MNVDRRDGERIFTIPGFLGADECRALIARAEGLGFGDAPIGSGEDAVVRPDYRDNARAMADEPELAAELFERARPVLPGSWLDVGRNWGLARLNERFRYYRYDPGQRFAPHFDGCYRGPDGATSFLTFLVYLSGGLDGGSTRFYRRIDSGEYRIAFEVRPEPGMALVFAHDELHEGAPVESGRKYVARTDVMYHILPR